MNKLNREISALRRQAAQVQAQALASGASGAEHVGAGGGGGATGSAPETIRAHDPTAPSVEVMLEAMRRENEQLRTRLVDTERDYVRIARLNDIYREELLELRRRVSCTVSWIAGRSDSLIPFMYASSGCRWIIWWG